MANHPATALSYFFHVVAVSLFFSGPADARHPRFKAVAFYSTKGEMDHVDFARDALYFFDLIAGQQEFTFDATTDWTNLNDDYLANYDVVIWLNDFPQQDEQRLAFERFINRGGAWFGFHVSAFNLPDSKWKWFNQFLGGAYFKTNNWPPLPAKVVVEDRAHPVARGMPATYDSPAGEWYQWSPSPRDNKEVRVLASLSVDNYPLGVKTQIKEGDTPVVWTNTRYKMIYMNMGHGNKIFSNDDQNRMMSGAVLWLGGVQRLKTVK